MEVIPLRMSLILFLTFSFITINQTFGQNSSFLAVSFGVIGIDDDELAIDYRLEYRAPVSFKKFSPTAGVQATSLGAVYSFIGFSRDYQVAPGYFIVPSLGAGAYFRGGGKNLGGLIEFRSGLEISYNLSRNTRASLAIHHLSNSSIYDRNPGTESIVLTYYFMH